MSTKPDKDNEYTILGYIRKMQNELNIENIPIELTKIIILYYSISEYFDKIPDCIQLSSDKMTITKKTENRSWSNTCYCARWINSMSNNIVSWTISSTNTITFGLYSNDDQLNEDFTRNVKGPCYAICNGATSFSHKKPSFTYNNPHSFSVESQVKYTIILNLKESTIYCTSEKTKNKMKYKRFNNIEKSDKIKYKLGISLYRIDSFATIHDYT